MLRALLTACAVTSLRSTRSATAGPVRHLLHRLALLGPAAQSCFLAMSFALLYAAVRFLLDALLISRRSESRLQAEVLALRYQLRVLQRQLRRPRWQPADRLFLSALSRLLPSPSWSSLLPSPETLLPWHRELVRRRWAAYRSRPRRPQPADRRARRETIVRLAEENPRWGWPRTGCARSGSPARSGPRRRRRSTARPRKYRRAWQGSCRPPLQGLEQRDAARRRAPFRQLRV